MMEGAPEFSRRIALAQLGPEALRQQIEATPAERDKLAQRFGLLALDRLIAVVGLHRQVGDAILLEAAFEAEFVQSCVVTLEPVPGAISDRFSLVYGQVEAAELADGLAGDEAVFEPLHGDAIDIGEAVAQELSLALPVFPRHPDAVIEVATTGGPVESPFSALARLRNQKGC
jgi:uncharacterized metal-binding protein YceD (DUF177 family)